MARTPTGNLTRLALATAVRTRGEFRSPYITDTELNGYLATAISELWDLIIQADPQRILSTSSISVVSGTAAYDLPNDYYLIKGVAVADADSPDGYRTLGRYDWPERHDVNWTRDKLAARWDVQGGQLWIWPLPNWSATLRLEYFPVAPLLSSDSTNFDGLNSWSEYVIASTLIKCAAKAEQDPSAFERALAMAEGRIRGVSPEVKGGGPATVVSVYGDRGCRRVRRMRRQW